MAPRWDGWRWCCWMEAVLLDGGGVAYVDAVRGAYDGGIVRWRTGGTVVRQYDGPWMAVVGGSCDVSAVHLAAYYVYGAKVCCGKRWCGMEWSGMGSTTAVQR
ncbi:hypothetical protein Vafri_19335 [Volvox africanus]|uniref:Uncharacterized protein n=1 Tax=Volvox africanus TaxID=51714 RepID=A0A8J4BNN8_9CHLO|nr:hypothetical protein Vafri_19335 [Volvox africanus]